MNRAVIARECFATIISLWASGSQMAVPLPNSGNAQGKATARPVIPCRVYWPCPPLSCQLEDWSFDGSLIRESYRSGAMVILWALEERDWPPVGLVVRNDDRYSIQWPCTGNEASMHLAKLKVPVTTDILLGVAYDQTNDATGWRMRRRGS